MKATELTPGSYLAYGRNQYSSIERVYVLDNRRWVRAGYSSAQRLVRVEKGGGGGIPVLKGAYLRELPASIVLDEQQRLAICANARTEMDGKTFYVDLVQPAKLIGDWDTQRAIYDEADAKRRAAAAAQREADRLLVHRTERVILELIKKLPDIGTVEATGRNGQVTLGVSQLELIVAVLS